MGIRKIPKDTKTFHYFNANPKNARASDCVIRALSVALNLSWQDVYKDLFEVGIKLCRIMNEPQTYMKYLEECGYTKHKQPKHEDGTKYTVEEFATIIAEEDATYVVTMANHMSVVKNKVIIDTWNCGKMCVGNYWVVR